MPRFWRVERCLQRHIRSGELWFVGRQGGRVVSRRLRTADLQTARAAIAMFNSNTNGHTEIFLVVAGKETPISDERPAVRDEPLPRMRQVTVPVETPTASSKLATSLNHGSTATIPTLEE